jgi:ABC-2 type transport system ATP-binding protein
VSAAIQTSKLTKYYGSERGVTDLDLEVRAGEVFGFLGPNGAGKTTTIRVLLDLIRPSSGTARVLGRDAQRDGVELRRSVGYVPGELALYGHLTGAENLRFLAALRHGVDWKIVDTLAERLTCDLARKVRELSTGNKRKVALIQAFMHRPGLLILDEPTSGLDPLVQHEFYGMLDEVRAEGRAVFLSSHMLPEMQRVCDRVAFVRDGRLLAVEDVAAIAGKAVHEIEITFADADVPAGQRFAALPGVSDLAVEGATLRFRLSGPFDPILKEAAAHTVLSLTSREPDLEDVFLAYYGTTGSGGRGMDGDQSERATKTGGLLGRRTSPSGASSPTGGRGSRAE